MAGGQCGRESKHVAPDDESDAVERVFRGRTARKAGLSERR